MAFRFTFSLLRGGAVVGAATLVGASAGAIQPNFKSHCLTNQTQSGTQDRQIHHRILVVGGGAAGVSVATQVLKQDVLGKLLNVGTQQHCDVAVVEPSDKHFYQPLFSLVSIGLYQKDTSVRPTAEVLPDNAQWIKDTVDSFDPEKNMVTLKSGCRLTYDYLIVAAGMNKDWHKIPGLAEGLQDPTCPIVSTYDVDGAAKTFDVLSKLEEGDLLFTMPRGASSDGSAAAQKPMWLWEDELRKKGVRHRTHVAYHSPTANLFHIAKYNETLQQLAQERNVEVLASELVQIDPEARRATFRDCSGHETQRRFAVLHAVPPQSPPAAIRSSALADREGFVEVDPATLQHARFLNVFALGDCAALPTTKTAAAVAAQAPVVAANLAQVAQGSAPSARYDGYTGSAILLGKKQALLCEHAYQDLVMESCPWDQALPSRLLYHLHTDVFPWQFRLGFVRGSWFGGAGLRCMPIPSDLLFRD